MGKKVVIISFVPVLHRGYLDFLARSGATDVYLLEASDAPQLPYLAREIRALRFDEARQLLAGIGFKAHRFSKSVRYLQDSDLELLMPNEDISRVICAEYFKDKHITFLETFLRWDWSKSVGFTPAQPDADRVIRKGDVESDEFSRYLQVLVQEQAKSSDWWRQVSAMARCRDGQVIVAHNRHLPNEYVPYIDGDPRNNFGPGEHIEVSSALHAEIAILAEAARRGISLEGADLAVSTFPCCGCAGAVSVSGIRRVFFTDGYSNLNGVKDLHAQDIELIWVEP